MKNSTPIALCPRCSHELTSNRKHISNKQYSYACLECDEDFFAVEVKFEEKKKCNTLKQV